MDRGTRSLRSRAKCKTKKIAVRIVGATEWQLIGGRENVSEVRALYLALSAWIEPLEAGLKVLHIPPPSSIIAAATARRLPFRQQHRIFISPRDPCDIWVTSFCYGLAEGHATR